MSTFRLSRRSIITLVCGSALLLLLTTVKLAPPDDERRQLELFASEAVNVVNRPPLDLFGSFKRPRKRKVEKEVNAENIFLVSSSPRTGSSYTAGLLTAMPDSAYFFEPVWLFRKSSNMSEVRMFFLGDKKSIHICDQAMSFIQRLLNCQFLAVKDKLNSGWVRQFVFRKPELSTKLHLGKMSRRDQLKFFKEKQNECKKSKFRVVKTFRLPLDHLKEEMTRFVFCHYLFYKFSKICAQSNKNRSKDQGKRIYRNLSRRDKKQTYDF